MKVRGLDADDVLRRATEDRRAVENTVRAIADWFHQQEGRLLPRDEAIAGIEEDAGLNNQLAHECITDLVSDVVDPVVQVPLESTTYIGVIDFWSHDWWYRYVHYDDHLGQLMRGVCAVCVQESTTDTDVVHATEGQGSIPLGAGVDVIREHLERHLIEQHGINPYSYDPDAPDDGNDFSILEANDEDEPVPDGGTVASSTNAQANTQADAQANTGSDTEGVSLDDIPDDSDMTGATLLSGSTIAGNTVWHAGNFDPASYSSDSHTHDDRYYTESETDSLLGAKADANHLHDDRYYTETQADGRFLNDTGDDVLGPLKFRDDVDAVFGNDGDFLLTYESATDELVLADGNVDLIRQPKSGPTQFLQGTEIGTIEAPEDSFTQLLNASVTGAAPAGGKVGYSFALDAVNAYEIDGEADGAGATSDLTHRWFNHTGAPQATLASNGDFGVAGGFSEGTTL